MIGGGDSDIDLFEKAVRLSPWERAAFLAEACGDDESLRRRIEALLRSNDRAGDATGGAEDHQAGDGYQAGDRAV